HPRITDVPVPACIGLSWSVTAAGPARRLRVAGHCWRGEHGHPAADLAYRLDHMDVGADLRRAGGTRRGRLPDRGVAPGPDGGDRLAAARDGVVAGRRGGAAAVG